MNKLVIKQPEICFFIGNALKLVIDEQRNICHDDGANRTVLGRLVGFVDPQNDQNKSSFPVAGWQLIFANEDGKECTFDPKVTTILNRRGNGDQRSRSVEMDLDRREKPDRRQQSAPI
ncbi:MAG: hypothetical protein WCV73_01625 [Patescibacteria group bacterium]|jgi:hypothetical protein